MLFSSGKRFNLYVQDLKGYLGACANRENFVVNQTAGFGQPSYAVFCVYDAEFYALFSAADKKGWVASDEFEGMFISQGVHWKYDKHLDIPDWCVTVSTNENNYFIIVSESHHKAMALVLQLSPSL